MAKRILVAEDEPTLAEAVVAFLDSCGWEARAVGNGCEALRVLEDWEADLILLDINMPVLDGPATLRELRSRPLHANAVVVMMSARPELFPPSEGMTHHQGRLRKPFTNEHLFAAVANTQK